MLNITQTFNIYRYGQLDRIYALRLQLRGYKRLIACKAKEYTLKTFDALDEFVEAFKTL